MAVGHYRMTKRQIDRQTDRQRDRETERQRDKETEIQRDRETENDWKAIKVRKPKNPLSQGFDLNQFIWSTTTT